MDTLVYPGYAEEIKETTTWICFMCAPQYVNGLLKRRIKWRAVLKHFYDQESVRKSSFKNIQVLLGFKLTVNFLEDFAQNN